MERRRASLDPIGGLGELLFGLGELGAELLHALQGALLGIAGQSIALALAIEVCTVAAAWLGTAGNGFPQF